MADKGDGQVAAQVDRELASKEAPEVARKRWIGVLARADQDATEELWAALGRTDAYTVIRGPEQGLVMVRGRAGGTGRAFNLGEMTVTRCTVRLAGGAVGHGYVCGRRPEHAERAALIDALMQLEDECQVVDAQIIGPLETVEEKRRASRSCKSAATKVDFFTMVRSE